MFPELGDVEIFFGVEQPYLLWGAAPSQVPFFSKFHWSISVKIMNGFLQNFQKFVY